MPRIFKCIWRGQKIIFILEPKGPQKLQIFPAEKDSKQTEKCQVGPIQTFPNSKTVKLFPAVFATERQTAVYFATELSTYLDIEADVQQQNQVEATRVFLFAF